MVNNTVNGKKIGSAAGKDDKLKFTYFACGKKNEKEKMDAKRNESKPEISLIDSLRKNGKIVAETGSYVAIKAYPGGRNKEEIIH
mgnify:CR=1 FL=1